MLIQQWHSRGYLPHFDGGDICQAITFRLIDSVPLDLLNKWREQVAHWPETTAKIALSKRIERYLDVGKANLWLQNSDIAQMVQDNLLYFDAQRYKLCAWVVMPNHVHILIKVEPQWSLSTIIHAWKSYTAKQANRLLNRQGKFWQEDYYDRYIRDLQHYKATINYIEANPIKAKLCLNKEDWLYSSASLGARAARPLLHS